MYHYANLYVTVSHKNLLLKFFLNIFLKKWQFFLRNPVWVLCPTYTIHVHDAGEQTGPRAERNTPRSCRKINAGLARSHLKLHYYSHLASVVNISVFGH